MLLDPAPEAAWKAWISIIWRRQRHSQESEFCLTTLHLLGGGGSDTPPPSDPPSL